VAKKAVFGIAKSESQAIMIADQLKAAGFTNNDVSVLFPDKQGTKDFAHEQHTKAPEGAATGATGAAGTVQVPLGPARLRTYNRAPETRSKAAIMARYCLFDWSIPTHGSPARRLAARGSGARSEVQVRPASVEP